MRFIDEFKAFAVRGNVVDLAVAVIIGTAFGKIVSSLVDTVLMPLAGMFMGGINFSSLAFTFGNAHIAYGVFIQNIVDFIIIAFVIFVTVKVLNRTKEEKPVVPSEPSEEVRLLREIRDVLKQ